jgi:Peptidase inhibitor family I36
MRKVIGLLALLTVLGALMVPASATAEEIVVEGSTILIEPGPTGEEEFALGDCSANHMCVWENNNFTGNFSQWPAWDTGCHNHASNPKLRSGWNRTGYTVRVGGAFYLGSGNTFQVLEGNPITGEICWPA